MTAAVTLSTLELQHEIEQFLYREAALLDAREFDAWVQLFADDVHYWAPIRSSQYIRNFDKALSGPDELAHFDDDKAQLIQRTSRLTTNMAWSDDPASQTRHLISNVRIETAERPDEFLVRSNFVVHQIRMERQSDVFFGAREDIVRGNPNSDAGWLISRRHVFLDQIVVLARAITTFF